MYLISKNIVVNVVSKKLLQNTLCFFSSVNIVSHSDKMANSGKVIARFDNIYKSAQDKRSYRGLELSNRLKVLLVSDPQTDKSAVAMDVNVGSLYDPDNLPGLAHFCEHMLFLGTEKYPNENDYAKFLSEHGGSSNASTRPDHTTYYFDVSPEHLKNALHRFAQFFICPLFTESATERELNAVHSEHEHNIANDAWRLNQLDKHLADEKHPYHKFGTGNKSTLDIIPKQNGINVRDELLKFHDTWYSSNIMSLGILGKESLDELEEMVVEMFSEIKDKNVEVTKFDEHPFSEKQFKTCAYVIPIKDVRNMNIIFPSPFLQDHYKSSPSGYISNLVGHEGPGSILSVLKERGWSSNLVSASNIPYKGVSMFSISVDLTEEGMDHTDEIVTLVFQYFNMLKKMTPQLWLHEEQRDIYEMAFRYKDKESPRSYIYSIVDHLQDYPMEDVLSNHYLLTEWEPELITDILNNFTPENIRVSIISKKFESETTLTEPWYGTKFSNTQIPEDTIEKWKNAGLCDELHLPEKNEFIPKKFDLYPLDKDITEYPEIIKDTAITRVWFKQDDKFLLPKTNLIFYFFSPLVNLDPLNSNLTVMFKQLFHDALNQYAYSAELANLKWDLTNTKYGLILSVGGYSDKQDIFLEKIMDKLINFEVDPKRFEIFKENYIRSLNNFLTEQPYQHTIYYLTVLLSEHCWTKQELLAATDQLSVEKLKAFIPQILSKMHIECMIHGNVNKQKALDLVDIVESKLNDKMKISPLLPRQLLLHREFKLEDGCNYLYEVQNTVHNLCSVHIYYECGLQTKESNIMLELFAQIIHEPCFNVLRTQEQLGYIVFSGLRRASGVQGVRIIIQSDKNPAYVDTRIEEFLKGMLKYLEDMSEEEFNKHKETLALNRLEQPKQLAMQTYIFWEEITTQQYHFDRPNVEVAYLRTLTKEDVIKFYNTMIEENASQRHKISVHVLSKSHEMEEISNNTEQIGKKQVIQDVTGFKSSHGMHPLVQPYINISRKGNKCKL